MSKWKISQNHQQLALLHRPKLNQPGGLDTKDFFSCKDQLFSYQKSVQVAPLIMKDQTVLNLESSSPNISLG